MRRLAVRREKGHRCLSPFVLAALCVQQPRWLSIGLGLGERSRLNVMILFLLEKRLPRIRQPFIVRQV